MVNIKTNQSPEIVIETPSVKKEDLRKLKKQENIELKKANEEI